MAKWDQALKVAAASHPRTREQTIAYGTAGFRTKAELLDHVMYRMGLLAVLRSRAKDCPLVGRIQPLCVGITIDCSGAMITASHNPGPDNGIKLMDPKGEMLEAAWESLATKLANCKDEDIPTVLDQIVEQFNIPEIDSQVVVGHDTRVSSPALSRACLAGIAGVKRAH